MLQSTFCHIKGIKADFEQLLWKKGITNWDDFLEKESTLVDLPREKLDVIKSELSSSIQAFQQNNFRYFQDMLNPNEHWRLVRFGKIGFVDIETTGLSRWSNDITVLGIYDGNMSHLYINGKNLTDAKEKIKEFDIIVTFNGKQFDIPFIEHYFSCKYDFVHLDLRYLLKEIGYSGGLKSIEKQLGINRDSSLEKVDGFEAIRLWNSYKRGNENALRTLLQYNEQDVVNLSTLLDFYLKVKIKKINKEIPILV